MKIKRLALCGILTAVALTIFVIEAQIPLLFPIPGIKLGLSNIVTLFALIFFSPKEALLILSARIILGSFFSGNPSTLIYSFAGGLLCFLGEYFLLRISRNLHIWEISAVGGVLHNMAQLITASLVLGEMDVFWYTPYLIISGIITGLFTGSCIHFLNKKHRNDIIKLISK